MTAIRESMRSPLDGNGPDKDERIVLGTLPPVNKAQGAAGGVPRALLVIIAIAIIPILLVLVPMYWDVLYK